MTARTWPSRRLQIAVILILLLGAVAQIFIPPISRAGRAEQLYHNAMLNNGTLLPDQPDCDENRDISNLEKALELSPGNSLYEQALVWRYHVYELPQLLSTHKMGRKATVFAEALLCDKLVTRQSETVYGKNPWTATELLSHIDRFCREDPGNSLPHYWKATFYMNLGREKEALLEVEKGNRIGCIHPYGPELSPMVTKSAVASLFLMPSSNLFTEPLFELSEDLSDVGRDMLRHGDISGACRVLEAGCQMGVCTAKSYPRSISQFRDGWGIFRICSRQLMPIYKDFGKQDRLKELRPVSKQIESIHAAAKQVEARNSGKEFFRSVAPLLAVQEVLISMELVALIFLLLCILPWGLFAIARRIRRRAAYASAAWGEGWLARLFLAALAPLPAIVAAMALFLPAVFRTHAVDKVINLSYVFDPSTGKSGWLIAILILASLQVIIAILVLRRLHRAYDEAEGRPTSFARFLFNAPLSIKAWILRGLSTAFAGEALFILCLVALVVIIYKPLVGCQPWQLNRLPSKYMAQETQFVKEQASGLKLNLGFGPEGKLSHSDKEKL